MFLYVQSHFGEVDPICLDSDRLFGDVETRKIEMALVMF